MNFYPARDLRTGSAAMWNDLSDGEEVVITKNGKPAALVLDVSQDNFEEVFRAVRQARAMAAFSGMRRAAGSRGSLADEETGAEIRAARNGR